MDGQLQLEQDYFDKVSSALVESINDLNKEYEEQSPNVYAVGDLFNSWDFEVKKMKALEAKKTFPQKIKRLESLKDQPYFGKIYVEEGDIKQEYYIGEADIYHNERNLVISWASEYGDLFYKKIPNFEMKDGRNIKLLNIRNFNIQNGCLIDFSDFEILHLDSKQSDLLKAFNHYISSDFLQNHLVNRNAKKLMPVFETIDQMQNEIIRTPGNQNVLVQGVSGSGKTTMGLQRLSYLIYQLEKNNRQSKILAVCPNNLFLDYIKNLVPNLNLNKVEFTSVQDLFFNLSPKGIKIAESKIKDDLTYHFTSTLDETKRNLYAKWFMHKGSLAYIESIESYVNSLKLQIFKKSYAHIHPVLSEKLMMNIFQKLEGVSFNMMIDRTIQYVDQILHQIDKEKAAMISQLFTIEFRNHKTKTDKVYKSFLKTSNMFGGTELDRLNHQQEKWFEEDIPALVYLSHLIDSVSVRSDYNHVFIDEAQDLNYIQYVILKKIYKNASFTIVGDLNQQIYLQRGLDSWDHITSIFDSELIRLDYNYRSSKEIMDLATSCLIDPEFKGVGVLETGVKPVHVQFDLDESLTFNWKQISQEYLEKWNKNKESVAIITNSVQEAETIKNVVNKIGKFKTKVITKNETSLDDANITIIPAHQVKGLEFNHVIVYNPSDIDYPNNQYFSKLLYMVLTRALYSLLIVEVDPLSELIDKAVMDGK
ncbi:UvrD-helicase domain-containing protein [Jeotgalibacillus aurantiacus]|uniref:UvrD-helicase domain-containing protein n=1 Tax=Jeotgalibacillus aurantiacus TaxID=2763266 RepID=UPI001D0BA4D3|nr:UvrD-helicase domain-containing protein [Jeotgalibacillus aurantiacus]